MSRGIHLYKLTLNYFFETTDAEPGKESEDIHELLNDLFSNTIFIAIERTELIFLGLPGWKGC